MLGVQSLLEDTGGDLYLLYSSGVLDAMAAGTTSFVQVETNVKSIELTNNNTTLNALTNAGNDWQFNGTVGTFFGRAEPGVHHRRRRHGGGGRAGLSGSGGRLRQSRPRLRRHGAVRHQRPGRRRRRGPARAHTFTASDDGTFRFNATFLTAGIQSLTAVDPSGLAAPAASITVNPGSVARFGISQISANENLPTTAIAGSPTQVRVTAYDAYGNLVTGYTGEVQFTSTDPIASLPGDYTFTAGGPTSDDGVHTFTVTFKTAGGMKLVAKDLSGTGATGDGSFSVTPGAIERRQLHDRHLVHNRRLDGTGDPGDTDDL